MRNKQYYLYIVSRSDPGNWDEYNEFLVSASSILEALQIFTHNYYTYEAIEWSQPAGVWDQARQIGISDLKGIAILMRSRI